VERHRGDGAADRDDRHRDAARDQPASGATHPCRPGSFDWQASSAAVIFSVSPDVPPVTLPLASGSGMSTPCSRMHWAYWRTFSRSSGLMLLSVSPPLGRNFLQATKALCSFESGGPSATSGI